MARKSATASSADRRIVEIFLEPIRKCAAYTPAFGHGDSDGLTLSDFHSLYGQDPFYAWIGLNDPLLYAAHKAAGGLTSVYRQVGVGSERLLRALIMQSLHLKSHDIDWRYQYDKPDGRKGVHILDAKIASTMLGEDARSVFEAWMKGALSKVKSTSGARGLTGAAFEIRQGYKSADSKRQNADLRFGIRAYQAGLLPVFAILSAQVSDPVIRRYRSDGMLVLTGLPDKDPTVSTFAFFKDVIGYDLASFFKRNSKSIRREIRAIVKSLLTPE
jgi:hypothetical protein